MKSSDICKSLVSLREKKGYTQADFASLIYVSQSTLSRWEKGTVIPSIQQLESICEMVDVSLADFFGIDTDEVGRLKKRIKWQKGVIYSIAISFAILLFIILLPKYSFCGNSVVYSGEYGETLKVYVKPLFFFSESGADRYGRKIAYDNRNFSDVSVIEVIYVTGKDEIIDEGECYSNIYFLKSLE